MLLQDARNPPCLPGNTFDRAHGAMHELLKHHTRYMAFRTSSSAIFIALRCSLRDGGHKPATAWGSSVSQQPVLIRAGHRIPGKAHHISSMACSTEVQRRHMSCMHVDCLSACSPAFTTLCRQSTPSRATFGSEWNHTVHCTNTACTGGILGACTFAVCVTSSFSITCT